ncbi:hypothetical protein [Halorientalis marina]|uniref:hypothetical protein n=1 Tax=Halorientalis marina TaxID=2931976 RepID=UPI001FF38CC4|nr:hypothetical protein [Halorientalis marina]
MRYKVVPDPPADRDGLAKAQRAVPRVPSPEDDCCARLRDRLDLASRDDGREWLTFLDAVGLATETARGFRRTDRDPDDDAVAAAFRERVFGAQELLDALDAASNGSDSVDDDSDSADDASETTDDSLAVADAFDALRPAVPTWERNRHDDWERVWTDRARRLLDWAVLFGLATRDGDYYRPA